MRRIAIIVGLFLATVSVARSASVREPAVSGQLYPADSTELRKSIDMYLNQAGALSVDGQLIALIVPHAGHMYSGLVAACGFKLLQNSGFDKVVLCGASHYVAYRGISVYGPGIKWKTPLGTVPCDDAVCNRLLAYDRRIAVAPEVHLREHSLEVELPFLQSVLRDFRIVPLAMGTQSLEEIDLLANALASLNLDDHTVMVASSDWQHYRPTSIGYKMDSLGMDCLQHLDFKKLQQYLSSGDAEMCGGGPVIAVLKAAKARGANRVKILKYGDSGDITGDKTSVVGYVAAAIYRSSSPGGETEQPKTNEIGKPARIDAQHPLGDVDKKKLLEIARRSIESYLENGRVPDFDVSESLGAPGAAFVTLNKNNQLRGCIGYTVAVDPLYKTVSECAIKAAVSDPRFLPVQASEVPNLKIEISVLTPLQKVESLDEIQVGRDGLIITLGSSRGLLLPQVATEFGWDRTQFLEQTCQKAGLPRDAYKRKETIIQRFQALVFGDKD